ncbi:MAG: EF-P lysine aminoacylase GenX [Proteobacteria bacterium]|nr:EF-P lysine aminoacylase GenX [Pseudomonadota bacterium]MBU1709688.1 EF-P lysine aminoacylase GenX [Pseudomonadota bacterium]
MLNQSGLKKRAALLQAIRRYFSENDYIEVDTPVLLPAIIPESYIEPERSEEKFLQTSPEICMKRLLATGASKIFQICKCFRHGERGRRHLTEFTMLEWYRVGINYHGLMDECEEMLRLVAIDLGLGSTIHYANREIALDSPFERITVAEAFKRFAPISLDEALFNNSFDQTLVEHIEPNLGLERPTFLYDYPASLGALARLNKDDPWIAERFELYAGGLELANGFSELTDPAQQRKRFNHERELIKEQGRDPGPMPEKFIEDLASMPEAAGIALGVDRLAMLVFDAESIDEVVTFIPEEL